MTRNVVDKISIIIPVYNVEPYIRKCLDSVIAQTHTNLEILLINDGSTDSSGKICDEYANKDNRIKVVHKENSGVASARNVGLDNFTGDYVGFIDPDDWVEPKMYEVLYDLIKNKNTLVSAINYYKNNNVEEIPMINKKQISEDVISAKNMLLYPLMRDYYMGFAGYLWNKLFSADIFRNNDLRFDENIKYASDVLFYYDIIFTEKCNGCYADKHLYHYRQRDGAISKSKSTNIKTDILIVYKRIEELLNDNGYSDINFWARGFYCYHASVAAEIAVANNDIETLRKMQAEIKNHLDDYIKTNVEFPEKLERMYGLLKR